MWTTCGQAARQRDEAAAAGQQQKGHCPRVYTQPHLSAQGPGPAHHTPPSHPSPLLHHSSTQPPPLVVTPLLSEAKFHRINEDLMLR